ncbi:glycine zipper 2TM domain-containing protein [Vineibacter terrae]|uniref:Glycine zipper 2TM domain-containing protein n=1 Tax=Vineibacter terrae TaxID=2586908 RepID=A0A5C8PJ86_9HYPH|nr:glycine zipper domain-containing protein [Vineibacter terrae]TXL73872.1 glycine zipper 2TM domain-containing protein [Vineibacter terrae]
MYALFRPRAVRLAIAAVLCAATLGGCAAGGSYANDPYLTPEQRRLRAQNQDFNRTVGEGAVVGALGGALLGALLGGKRNRAAGALIGAGAGALLGGGAGYYVGKKKEQYVNENQRLDSMTADVRNDNARLEAYVANTRTVVAQNKAELARLRAEYNARQASRDDLNRRVATAEQDASHIRQTISRLRERLGDYIQARNATRAENPGASTAAMDAEIARLNQQIAALEAQLAELNSAISITRTG